MGMLACQVSVWLLLQGESIQRGQVAILMACITFLVSFSFVIVQDLHGAQAMAQIVGLILLLSGLALVTIDDRVWDWRYAYSVLFSIISATYINYVIGTCRSCSSGSTCHLCSLVIMQPILFIEEWLVACLLSS